MTDGRRWLAIDADLFGKPFTHDVYNRFGWAGVAVWVAFLCACKKSRTPGRISVMNDAQAASELGIDAWDLVDNKGEPWTLTEFWAFTGRKKQTRRTSTYRRDARRTATGQRFNIDATHWQRWQDSARTATEAERMRRSRAEKRSGASERSANSRRTNVRPDIDLDLDIPPTPPGEKTSSPNGQVKPEDLALVDLGTAVGELKAAMRGEDG